MSATTPPRSLKERQRLEREDLILQAAEEVFVEKGYYNASMDEIAARVGIAKGTLYLHFACKEDMVAALLKRKLEAFKDKIESIISEEGTARDKLSAILHIMYADVVSSHHRLIFSFYHGSEIPPLLREKRAEVINLFSQIAEKISFLIEEGKATGDFDTSIPTEITVSIFFSLLPPPAYKRLVVEGSMQPEELAKYIERVFFNGITA
jgi:TetR/AcrR family fatty acid metabolism transcriptional regulator